LHGEQKIENDIRRSAQWPHPLSLGRIRLGSSPPQVLKEDRFARQHIAPKGGIEKKLLLRSHEQPGTSTSTAPGRVLCKQAQNVLPKEHVELGDLKLIDGSLIDATLSMHWTDYRKGSKKAKAHLGFDLNYSIPTKLFLTDGKADERPFVNQILSPGQPGVMDRYDLSAEQIAMAYKLRWNIEIFFGWWKRYLHFYHLIAKTRYGLMVQMLAGLITYVLLAIYCHNQFDKKVSVRRIRQLRIQIKNELRQIDLKSSKHALDDPSNHARAPNAIL